MDSIMIVMAHTRLGLWCLFDCLYIDFDFKNFYTILCQMFLFFILISMTSPVVSIINLLMLHATKNILLVFTEFWI